MATSKTSPRARPAAAAPADPTAKRPAAAPSAPRPARKAKANAHAESKRVPVPVPVPTPKLKPEPEPKADRPAKAMKKAMKTTQTAQSAGSAQAAKSAESAKAPKTAKAAKAGKAPQPPATGSAGDTTVTTPPARPGKPAAKKARAVATPPAPSTAKLSPLAAAKAAPRAAAKKATRRPTEQTASPADPAAVAPAAAAAGSAPVVPLASNAPASPKAAPTAAAAVAPAMDLPDATPAVKTARRAAPPTKKAARQRPPARKPQADAAAGQKAQKAQKAAATAAGASGAPRPAPAAEAAVAARPPAPAPASASASAAADVSADALANAAADATTPGAEPTPAQATAPTPEPTAPPVPPPPAPRRSGLPHSRLVLTDGDQRQIAWLPGADCPASLAQTFARRLDTQGHLPPDDDQALPLLLRLAAEGRHRVDVAPEVWLHLAAHRDNRTRCAVLAAAYPDGPASAALQRLLAVPLPLFQAEGALWAVVAGRALLADAPGLGKGVQAIAAAQLWRRHFGLRRVAVLCTAAQAPAWQRAWQLLAGVAAQLVTGGLHQRQALWSTDAEVRILTPDALASDAAHLAHWAPDLALVDEPQRLIDATLPAGNPPPWAALPAPHALVLCGGPLDTQPELLDGLIDWLDPQRLGPLAALRRVRAARDAHQPLAEDALEQVAEQLSRVLLQREADEVAEQLPPVITSVRLLPLTAAQQEVHAGALREARLLVQAWQRSGFVSDADQWRLSALLGTLQQAAHRAEPTDAHSPLADAVLQAAEAQWADWAESAVGADGGPRPTVLLCDSPADRDQLALRLGAPPGLHLLAPGQALPVTPERVLQVGVPWRARRQGVSGPTPAEPGQHWVLLAARDSIDIGLLDTLAARQDVPHGPAERGGRGFLQGDRLGQWLRAVAAALQALPADAPPAGAGA